MRRGGPHARAEATRTAGTWSGPQRPPSPASSSDGFEVIAGTPGTASAAPVTGLPAQAYIVLRPHGLAVPRCSCHLCCTRADGTRPLTGVHTGFDSDGRPLSGLRLWSKLAPFFSALPALYIHEYRWCIEPWVSERSALEAWPSAALRFGHSNLEPARHLWLEASAIQTLRATYREP
jgi:hypothetical protein